MVLSNSERKAKNRVLDDWRCAPQILITPFTAGSGLDFPVAKFTDAHYEQEDISLNKVLWALWPVSPPDGYARVQRQTEAKRNQ